MIPALFDVYKTTCGQIMNGVSRKPRFREWKSYEDANLNIH
jgi:hypothetical protein